MAIKGYNQKPVKKVQPKDNHLKVSYVLPEDTSESVVAELLDVLKTTKFNRISFPVSTYRYYLNSDVAPDDNRVITIGYVKNFNAEKGEFTVVIFNNNKAAIEVFTNPVLEVVFSEYNGKLGCITKLNIIDMPVSDNTASVNEEAEPAGDSAVVYTPPVEE